MTKKKMRKIYFDKLQSAKNGILLGLSILCFIISGIDFFTEKVENLDRILRSIGHLFLILIWCKILIFRNYAYWNNLGIHIGIRNFFGKRFQFKKIINFQLEKNILIINQIGNKKHEFDLTQIDKSSQEKLIMILDQNTVGNIG